MREFIGVVKQIESGEDGYIVALISTPSKDRMGDIVDPLGVVPGPHIPLLWAHDQKTPAIGVVEDIKATETGVEATIKVDIESDLGKEIYRKLKTGILRSFSIGFRPIEYERIDDGYHYTKWELLEVSVVNVPANPEALAIAVRELEIKEPKWRVVPYQDLDVDTEASWDAAIARAHIAKWASIDGSGDKDKIDWEKYRKAFLVYDANAPDNFTSYKFPIADVINDKLVAVWRGIVAAMAAILGARGGTKLPEDIKKRMYNHLVKYYKKIGREPPEYKEISWDRWPISSLKDFDDLTHALLGILEGDNVIFYTLEDSDGEEE